MFTVIHNIFRDLHASDVRFVHWKSNVDLDKALEGYDDLDLLVDPSALGTAISVLTDHGLIEGADRHIRYPHVWHYYGNDAETGSMVHIHLYAQVVTGSSWTKSYLFPWTDLILDSATTHESGTPITAPHIEFALYIARCCTKQYSLLEAVVTGRHAQVNPRELKYLTDRLDSEALDEFVREHLPDLTSSRLCTAAEALATGDRSHSRAAARMILEAIRPYRRHSRLVEALKSTKQLLRRSLRRLTGRRGKTPFSRTRFIAITGLDASGKSTSLDAIESWLGENFRVDRIHLGAPPSAWATAPFNLLIRAIRPLVRSGRSEPRRLSKGGKISVGQATRYLALAYDRSRHAVRRVGQGTRKGFVISDRYPAMETGVMDSRRIPADQDHILIRRLAIWENALYDRIPRADLVVRLHVPVEIAVERNRARHKPDKESETALRERYEHNAGLTYSAHSFKEIDTSGGLDETMLEIKRVVWDHIANNAALNPKIQE